VLAKKNPSKARRACGCSNSLNTLMGESIAHEESFHSVDGHLSSDGGDGFGEGDILGADFDAVLCVAAIVDPA